MQTMFAINLTMNIKTSMNTIKIYVIYINKHIYILTNIVKGCLILGSLIN